MGKRLYHTTGAADSSDREVWRKKWLIYMDNNIGKKLDGRYELLELIGVGGMADIYRARDIQEDEIVAVKILKTEFAGSDEFLRRFRNESKAIALLSHPNIVKIYDVGFTDKVQFIVMEYVDGITLTDYIEQQGVLKWRDAVHFTVQVLKALMHAHDRGIVHRDVKSSNIMLLRDGTIKVMDFGIARFNRENNKTMSEKTIGSVHYISPEQARGDITDERSDIYSVGVALYEMLTGKKPFDGDTPVAIALKHMQSTPKKPTEINETIPEGLEQIVLRAMQKEPSARYQTAGEMINDLDEFKKNPGIVFDYKYNSTDGSTKYFDRPNPAVDKELLRRKKAVQEEEYDEDEDDDDYYDDDDDEYEDRRSPLIPILFAVGAAFVIATVFLVLKLVVDGLGNGQSEYSDSYTNNNGIVVQDGEFPMPSLIGMSWDEAMARFGDESLMKLVPQQEWSEIVENQIFDQEFAEGRRVKVGASVVVKVSKGIKQLEIQDFRDRTVAAAEQQLRKDGFVPSKTYKVDEEIAKDRVIETNPPAHTMAKQGSTVVLVVSLGPSNSSVVVPKLTGMPIEGAKTACTQNHLVPIVQYVPSDEEEGKVLAQSIPQGDLVDRNTEIILSVSMGMFPDVTSTVEMGLPVNLTGQFQFTYWVDSILDPSATEVRDLGMSGTNARVIKYDVTGKKDEVKTLVIKVKSMQTGKEGVYMEVGIDFSKTPPEQNELQRNSLIFKTLLNEDDDNGDDDY
ncbi:MAG: Stk1 family PASTA domain-containing Ser/Thr kinase [Oscillospiraceae bacterium]|nr:Stk1 family PASTA domain-containing Ser/Thr kinase [Oscillospiraceae bacterium]